MDTIFIENLTYTGIHGVYKEEHHIPQRFNIWITMEVNTKKASESDDVEDTVDYKKLQEFIKTVIEGEHHCLIEKIAGIIGDKILEDHRVESCEVTIKKLDAFDVGTPGVTLRRKQETSLLDKKSLTLVENLIQDLEIDDVVALPLLSKALCDKIKHEATRFPFVQAEKVFSKNNVAEQNFSYFRDYPNNHFLWYIARELEQLIQSISQNFPSSPFETPLSVTEISSHHYEICELGISLHRDESRFKNMIIICIIEGEADFCAITQKGEKIIRTKPGDVIFMRAPGFMNGDIRPIHAVKNITSPRLSVTFRQELPEKGL